MPTKFYSVPVGSLYQLDERERLKYLKLLINTPDKVRDLVFSSKTGSYIEGLSKSRGFGVEKSAVISFGVARVVAGDLKLADLAVYLSSAVPVAMDKAQEVALEIEQDLFAPIKDELDLYLKKNEREEPAKKAAVRAKEGGAKNVLNLKEEKKLPVPPPMPSSRKT